MRSTTNDATEPTHIIDPEPPPEVPVKGPGRDSLFNPDYCHLARVMCEQGFTSPALARAFQVDRTTIIEWQKRYPAFKDAVQEGRDYFNTQQAEAALTKRVTGYDYVEETHELKPMEEEITPAKGKKAAETKKKMVMVLTKRVKKHVAPSDRAIEYFLNNRSRFVPDKNGNVRWAHHNRLEITGPGGKDLEITTFNPEKLLAELIATQKQEDDIVEAEIVAAKRIGVETHEEPHKENSVPDAR